MVQLSAPSAGQVQHLDGGIPVGRPLVALHVQSDALSDVLGGADGVDAALGLAEAAVAAFDGIGSGRQQLVIQEGKGFLQIRREQLVQRAADSLETADPSPQAGQFVQGGLGPASPVEQTIHLVHDLSQRAQVRQAKSDSLDRFSVCCSQVVLNEQATMVEQVGDSLLDSLGFAGLGLVCLGGTATRKGWLLGLEFLADLGYCMKHGLCDLFENVELTDLMGGPRELFGDNVRIQRGTIGCDSTHIQASGVQMVLEPAEELPNVPLTRGVVEYPAGQTPERVVVHDRQYAERPIVDFVGRQVPAERRQGLVEVFGLDAGLTFFPPPPRPSSES